MPNRQDQNTEDSYPREVDYEPDPELFDVKEVSAEIWDAIHPEG